MPTTRKGYKQDEGNLLLQTLGSFFLLKPVCRQTHTHTAQGATAISDKRLKLKLAGTSPDPSISARHSSQEFLEGGVELSPTKASRTGSI